MIPVLLSILLGCGGAADPHGHAHGPLVHRFEDARRWSREFDDPARAAWQKPEEVARLMAIEPGSTVVDLGAGTGYFLAVLSRAVGPRGRVLALDVEASMVRWMRDRASREGLANVEARVVAFDDPALAPNSVDRVLIVDTWHHVPARVAYVRRLLRALRPGGAVFVVDFTRESPRGPPVRHRLLPAVVRDELAAGGLQADVVPETLPLQYVVRGRRP